MPQKATVLPPYVFPEKSPLLRLARTLMLISGVFALLAAILLLLAAFGARVMSETMPAGWQEIALLFAQAVLAFVFVRFVANAQIHSPLRLMFPLALRGLLSGCSALFHSISALSNSVSFALAALVCATLTLLLLAALVTAFVFTINGTLKSKTPLLTAAAALIALDLLRIIFANIHVFADNVFTGVTSLLGSVLFNALWLLIILALKPTTLPGQATN